jgi:putative oxidoreductase
MIHVPGILNSLGLLILRLGFGGMMAFGHGLPKLLNAAEMQSKIADPLNLIPSPYAFYCLVGAEFFCALLVGVGLLTRFGALAVAYAMGVAAFVAHAKDPIFMTGNGASMEPALVYLIAFVAIVFTGPGSFSLDRLLFGRPRPQV